jgi:hypothetical protein
MSTASTIIILIFHSLPGLLIELIVKPSLIKTAFLFAAGQRKRVIQSKTDEIRKEVERLLIFRAIKAKKSVKFVFAEQQL